MQLTNNSIAIDVNTMMFLDRTNPLCSDKEYLEHNRIRFLWLPDTFCYRESYFF